MEYKRLTMKADNENTFDNIVNCVVCPNKTEKYECRKDKSNCLKAVINRLAELEDKIENGTLIEIDHSLIGQGIVGIHHFTDGTYQLDLDENIVIGFAINGVITWNGTHHYNDEFSNGMFFMDNEKGRAKAEQKLRELEFKQRVDCGNATIIEN